MEVALEPAAADVELNCPLCGYDLRGLPSDRCPECGHAFDLEQIRRAKLQQRDWFFESARHRTVLAFVKTWLASLRPIRFWGRVSASFEVVPRRLIAFAVTWLMLVTLTIGIAFSVAAAMRYYELITATNVGNTPVQAQFMWVNGRLVRAVPAIPSWYNSAVFIFRQRNLAYAIWPLIAVIVWPAVAVAALQLFGLTLRKAGIRAGHLWRSVLYAAPLTSLPLVALVALSCFYNVNNLYEWPLATGSLMRLIVPPVVFDVAGVMGITRGAVVALGLASLLSTIHLSAAHVRYLRLPHAIAQALLVQIVAGLFILAVAWFAFGAMS